MAKRKQLSKKQVAVINDMFSGQLDEQSALDRHGVSRNVYNRWLADENFSDEFDRRIASAHRQSEFIVARYAPLAAAKLVQLTDSKSEETARKACLDIISLPAETGKKVGQPDERQISNAYAAGQVRQLSEQTVSKLLAALAEEKGEENPSD